MKKSNVVREIESIATRVFNLRLNTNFFIILFEKYSNMPYIL